MREVRVLTLTFLLAALAFGGSVHWTSVHVGEFTLNSNVVVSHTNDPNSAGYLTTANWSGEMQGTQGMQFNFGPSLLPAGAVLTAATLEVGSTWLSQPVQGSSSYEALPVKQWTIVGSGCGYWGWNCWDRWGWADSDLPSLPSSQAFNYSKTVQFDNINGTTLALLPQPESGVYDIFGALGGAIQSGSALSVEAQAIMQLLEAVDDYGFFAITTRTGGEWAEYEAFAKLNLEYTNGDPAAVPEPSALLLCGAGLVGLACVLRCRRCS